MLPAMSFIPPECMSEVCNAQRKAQGENSIKNLADAVKNNTKATELLIKDTVKEFEQATEKIAEGIGDFAEQAKQGFQNLYNSFNIYQLCPRRFNDWLTDATSAFGLPGQIDLFSQLQTTFLTKVVGGFSDLLNNCVTKTLTNGAVVALNGIALRKERTISRSIKKWKL